jgi:hypothetical protein
MTVSLGCIHDDVRSEPGSWIVVGMIPIFDKKKANRSKLRTEDGPQGAAHQRIEITHLSHEALLEGWNSLTEGVKIFQWAGSVWRRTRLLLQAFFSDQSESDTYCCDCAQSCKLCHYPKDQLHLPVQHAPKYAHAQEVKVLRAADGTLNDKAGRLFNRQGSNWKPTDGCTKAAYERQRKALNGTHVMPNRLWGIKGLDVQHMVCMCIYLQVIVGILNVFAGIPMYTYVSFLQCASAGLQRPHARL